VTHPVDCRTVTSETAVFDALAAADDQAAVVKAADDSKAVTSVEAVDDQLKVAM
jgi:hypothetical protein